MTKDTLQQKMALIAQSNFAGKEFKMINQEFVPNIEIGILNVDQFDKVLDIVGENFFNGDVQQIKSNLRSFVGLPINYSEL